VLSCHLAGALTDRPYFLDIAISADGTTHKSVEYLSSHLTMPVPDSYEPGNTGKGPKTRMMPVAALADKSAASQFEYFNSTIDSLLETYKDTDLARERPLRWQEFIARAHAFLADHAADQDSFFALLSDWRNQAMDELRGIEVLESMSDVDLLQAYAKHKNLPGSTNWDGLTEPELDSVLAEAWIELCIPFGKAAYKRLSAEERRQADRFIRAGCCMHKSLNVIKYAYKAMAQMWTEADVEEKPMKFYNQDNDASRASGSAELKERADKRTEEGLLKWLSLWGSFLHHKNDKKGEQDRHKIFFEVSRSESFKRLCSFSAA
jgi:hypothetical protein